MSNCIPNTCFKNVDSISDDFLLNILEANFKTYLDWAFLKIGAWFDVNADYGGIHGGNPHIKLLPVIDSSYSNGQVWQTIRKDWVWETGIAYNSGIPIDVSGIYINSSFVPLNSGTYKINYPQGRITFNSPVSTSANILANYSYRYVQVYRANDAPWFNKIHYSSLQNDNKDIVRADDGTWSIGSYQRIQMPAIIVESVPRSRSFPYELGNDNLRIEQDLELKIVAENKNDRNKLLDILRLQQDNVIILYNSNTLAANEDFPLDYDGSRKSGALMYPDMVSQYKYRTCFIKSVDLFELDSVHPNLHMGMARVTTEIISQ